MEKRFFIRTGWVEVTESQFVKHMEAVGVEDDPDEDAVRFTWRQPDGTAGAMFAPGDSEDEPQFQARIERYFALFGQGSTFEHVRAH